MKKIILLLALCGLSTLSMTAQDDDLYFTPKKSHKAKAFDDNTPAYYVGSNRAVDEYNRRGKFRSSYQKIDGDSISDVIDLQAGDGLYPDSTYVDSDFAETLTKKRAQGYRYDDDDFEYTRRMADMDTTTHGTLGIGIMPVGIRHGIAVGIRLGIMEAIMVATGVAIGDGMDTTTLGTDQDGVV